MGECGSAEAMPLNIRQLLLATPMPTNASKTELTRTYQAIEVVLGVNAGLVAAAVCRRILMMLIRDNEFGSRAVAALASMTYVLSDAMLCYMEVAEEDSDPLYSKIRSDLTEIDREMGRGKDAWLRYYRKRSKKDRRKLNLLRQQQARSTTSASHNAGIEVGKAVIISVVEEAKDGTRINRGSLKLCGQCETCKATMSQLKSRSHITPKELIDLVQTGLSKRGDCW